MSGFQRQSGFTHGKKERCLKIEAVPPFRQSRNAQESALVGIREAPRSERITHARILHTFAMARVLPPAQRFASTMRGQGL